MKKYEYKIESSLFQNTMSTTDIVATWKREVNN